MCNCKGDRPRLVRLVNDAWKEKRERWAIIENRSGNLEVVPESQLTELTNVTINYKLEENGK